MPQIQYTEFTPYDDGVKFVGLLFPPDEMLPMKLKALNRKLKLKTDYGVIDKCLYPIPEYKCWVVDLLAWPEVYKELQLEPGWELVEIVGTPASLRLAGAFVPQKTFEPLWLENALQWLYATGTVLAVDEDSFVLTHDDGKVCVGLTECEELPERMKEPLRHARLLLVKLVDASIPYVAQAARSGVGR